MRFTTTTYKRQNQPTFQRPEVTWRFANPTQSGNKAVGVAIILLIAIGCVAAFIQTMDKTKVSVQQVDSKP